MLFMRRLWQKRWRSAGWLSALIFLSVVDAAGQEQVKDTRFNYKRGFYWEPFTVVVQSKTTSAKIRYTTDGSLPGPTHGLGNRNPVTIDISRTTVLRAMAYEEGKTPSNVDTQSYLFLDDNRSATAGSPRLSKAGASQWAAVLGAIGLRDGSGGREQSQVPNGPL
jgi:hypothetical protein